MADDTKPPIKDKPGTGTNSKAATLTVVNLRKNPVRCAGVEIAPHGKVELTAEQQKDSRLMAKLQHGVTTGVFAWGE